MRRTRSSLSAGAVAAAIALSACSDSTTEPAGPDLGTITVDAVDSWTYVTFNGEDAAVVNVSNAAASTAWDIGIFGSSVMLNGGSAGPGTVEGYCVCQNAGATNAQVQAFTSQNQLAAFEAVTAADLPAESAWKSDALAPAMTGWYRYNPVTHTVLAAPEQSFYIRTSEGSAYAKFHVTSIEGATREAAGRVTFEYAVQASAGAAMGAVQARTVEVPASGRVWFDFETGTASQNGWDISFEGFTIRVNGGVSGAGSAGAVAVTSPFASIDDASEAPAGVYKADAFGGVFDTDRWYRYNLTGTDHQIWPTFDVYLIRKGSDNYKVQLTSYYGPAGESRHVSIRYAKVGP